ncbi:MAG: outer membrane beta-barrel protein [Hyphomicrobium sp.]|uniref:outer membrane protein n=1 Tax=Hyphomicrobium sp. TaxID=82 RepID=UPI0013256EC2|nr:outer membrane beta-barrel protein [Hyphomicrobium sp.]KAB2940316.1 MAG: porin family protein [Hyphomicrobium sp.]MBZ0211134.1 outer membrane beta-barrel protein [Hyphomicrobium sp.]
MGKLRALSHLALAAAAAGALAFDTPAMADGWQPGEPGRWVPGTPMTDCQCVTDWSGVYVGGKLGGVWADAHWEQDLGGFDDGGAVPPGTQTNFGPSGFAGGVITGANLQMGNWIFGAEFSFSGTGLSESVASPFFPATDTFTTDIDWLMTVEGRIGYSWDRVMVFGKGGFAGGNATMTMATTRNGGLVATDEEFADGWTLGGGIEYAHWPSVILGLEYSYTYLSLSTSPDCPLCLAGIPFATPGQVSGGADISAVMARASYLFKPED